MKPAAAKKHSLDLHDSVDLVDTIVSNTDRLTAIQADIAEARAVLDEQVSSMRRLASYSGVLIGTVNVRGSNRSVSYTFSNHLTRTSVTAEDKIRADLGEHYETLFTREKTVKVREGAMDTLRELLGDRFNDLCEVTETIVPKPEFRQNVHEIRQTLDPTSPVREKLDTYEVSFTAKPSMKVGG
jgi:hypothetical protein